MKPSLIHIFLSIIPFIAAGPEPSLSDVLPTAEDTVHVDQEEPGNLRVLLNADFPTFQGMHLEDEVARVCTYGIVFFQVPQFRAFRRPIFILADLREIYRAVERNDTDFSRYNVHIQQLLFERLLILDGHSDVSVLQTLDRSFRDTYEILYNKIFNSPVISTERSARVQEVLLHLLELRSPLIRVLYFDRTTPNGQELNTLRSALTSAVELQVAECPHSPDERLMLDILRGISVILARIMSMMFEGMTRCSMSTQTAAPVTPCASNLVYSLSLRPGPT